MPNIYRQYLYLLLSLVIASSSFAELNFIWTEILRDETLYTQYGDVGDIDNDGDYDIVRYSHVVNSNPLEYNIHLHENDGQGGFIDYLLSDDIESHYPSTIDFIDANIDGYLDIRPVYYTVLMNDQQSGFYEYDLPYAGDLIDYDNDGDLDIIHPRGLIYESEGDFGPWNLACAAGFAGPPQYDITLSGDVDNDNDFDFVIVEEVDDGPIYFGLTFYENDGEMNFIRHPLGSVSSGDWFQDADLADIDGDGDLDMISAEYSGANDGALSWWEFEDASFTEHVLYAGGFGAGFVDAFDIDQDNDMDIIGTRQNGNGLAIYVNDGNENFSLETTSYTWIIPRCCRYMDFDFDGDIDMIVDGIYGFHYLENQEYSSVTEPDYPTKMEIVSLYPNPFNSSVNINVNLQQPSNLNVTIFNLIGQRVATLTNQHYGSGLHQMSWDATNYQSGTYIVRINSSTGEDQTKKIVYLK